MMRHFFRLLTTMLLAFGAQSILGGDTIVRVTDVNPGGRGLYPSYLTVFQGQLYFRGNTGLQDTELWRFDGTNASRAADINPGAGASLPSYLAVLGGNLYFDAFSPGTGHKLRRFDGATVTVVNTVPETFSGSGSWSPVSWGGYLWFLSSGRIHRFDGAGMSWLATPPWANSEPVLFNGSLYYAAQDTVNGVELWRFNGASQTRVTDIHPGAGDASPEALFVYQGALYFRARDASSGNELWRYDGSAAQRVADINPGAGDSNPSGFARFNNLLYFQADDGVRGAELWRYDGANVSLAANINLNPIYEQGGDRLSDSNPRRLTAWNGALHFIANNGQEGGLWRFDGTNAVILGGGSPNGITELIVFQNALYFDADDGTWGRELWRVETTPEPRLAIGRPTGQVELQLSETETGTYVIEGTTNLTHWTPLSTNRPVDGRIVFIDSGATNGSRKIYRAVKGL